MSTNHHTTQFDAIRRREIIQIRRQLIRLQDEARLLRRDLLQRKYSPDQPRVPAGSAGGGQWTSGGGGGAGRGFGFGSDGGSGLAEFGPGENLVVDETGQEAWAYYSEGWSEDGSVFERDIVNRDGSTIQSEYAASRALGWDERQTVTLPDGAKTIFETEGRTQTIRDGGPEGAIISRTVWTPGGPEPDATVQPAFAGPLTRGVGAAGSILFGWLSPFNGPNGQQAVMGFNARDFRPSESGRFEPGYIGQISQSEAEAACQYLPEIQSRLNDAAASAGPVNNYPSAAVYGTVVHLDLKRQIEGMYNPNLVAERSFLKEAAEETGAEAIRYGYPGSVRIDAYERRADGTLCVYDVKTGRAGLSLRRSDILARAGYWGTGRPGRIIVIEVRPSA